MLSSRGPLLYIRRVESPPAPSGKLVVAHAERDVQRTLQRVVGAALSPVVVVDDAAALVAAVDGDTIAIVDANLACAAPNLCMRPARAWIAVPGGGTAASDAAAHGGASAAAGGAVEVGMDAATIDALLTAGWGHVIAHPMPVLGEELLATVQKLRRSEVFGLEKYVTWAAEIRSYALEDTCDRDDAVAAIARDIVGVGLPERVGSLVTVIADELIANALYVAPVDEHKQRYRAGEAREKSRALRGRDIVTVRWATDARHLALEVRDRWGTLDPAAIAGHLVNGRGASAARADGGMGLALAYACCNQFMIDLQPDVMTEVIALLDVRPHTGELARSASFHTFVIAPPGEPA